MLFCSNDALCEPTNLYLISLFTSSESKNGNKLTPFLFKKTLNIFSPLPVWPCDTFLVVQFRTPFWALNVAADQSDDWGVVRCRMELRYPTNKGPPPKQIPPLKYFALSPHVWCPQRNVPLSCSLFLILPPTPLARSTQAILPWLGLGLEPLTDLSLLLS